MSGFAFYTISNEVHQHKISLYSTWIAQNSNYYRLYSLYGFNWSLRQIPTKYQTSACFRTSEVVLIHLYVSTVSLVYLFCHRRADEPWKKRKFSPSMASIKTTNPPPSRPSINACETPPQTAKINCQCTPIYPVIPGIIAHEIRVRKVARTRKTIKRKEGMLDW